MKSILRNTALYTVALFILPQVASGILIKGGLPTYIFGGFILAILFMIVKPVLHIITLPLNMISFGIFSIVINAILLYILTVAVPTIDITSFKSDPVSLFGISIPSLQFRTAFAYIAFSLVLSAVVAGIKWLFEQ